MFKVTVTNRGAIYPPYVGTVRAVPRLCELYRGHCLTARKQPVRVVGKCQVDTIQCVDMAALRE